jgi:hypothetical protein
MSHGQAADAHDSHFSESKPGPGSISFLNTPMKTFLTLVGVLILASPGFTQTPAPIGSVSPIPTASVSESASATITPAAESDLADKIHRRIDSRMRQHGVHFSIGDDGELSGGKEHNSSNDVPEAVIPLVAIIFMTVFGAPVLIVGVIMYFGFSRNRMMHKTIRMMVEKGQPVPPALLAPPAPAQRQRSDLRRGVVLGMIGIGLILFFGAVNDWENGAWAIGVVPALIGAGYLLVWKLEGGQKPKPDNPPPLP